MAILNLETI